MTEITPTATFTDDILIEDIHWLDRIVRRRIHLHTQAHEGLDLILDEPPPLLNPNHKGPYADRLHHLGLEPEARLVLALALAPHLRPEVLDALSLHNTTLQRRFTEFGGMLDAAGVFIPTRQTALFVLAGTDLEQRMRAMRLFHPLHPLQTACLFETVEDDGSPSTLLAAPLRLRPAEAARATGLLHATALEGSAELISTPYGWKDLVVDDQARRDLDDILAWQRHRKLLLDTWGLRRSLKPGFRTLFYGPPGTGKTLTAALIGQEIGQPVFRVDASRIVSKYIGETEKALSRLFERAEGMDVVLFFDEADSLFGARVETRNSNDRFANQEVAYLLQRIEAYEGLVILASNMKGNIDAAFLRRFETVVAFSMPTAVQRLALWEGHFRDHRTPRAEDVDLVHLSERYELSGGSILNALRHAALRATRREVMRIHQADLVAGAIREVQKSGKMVT